MVPIADSACPLTYRPALAWFATLGSAWVFVLLMLGAFTTSIGAGMAFPDWPLSGGSVNPRGWLTNLALFAEHSHRLSGATMGAMTLGLALWLWRCEERAWLRRLGWIAVGFVIVQGVIGGTRVLLDAVPFPLAGMTLGQFLRIPHGILAQMFVCVLFAIAAGLSRPWTAAAPLIPTTSADTRRLAWISAGLLWVQLVVATVMRHTGAGLAIPTFPLTPQGGLMPEHWDFAIAIHFCHRILAVALVVMLSWLAAAMQRDRQAGSGLKGTTTFSLVLLTVQILFGAATVWSHRNPYVTTAHVIVGAVLFATVFTLAWWTSRPLLERLAPSPTAPPRFGAGLNAHAHP